MSCIVKPLHLFRNIFGSWQNKINHKKVVMYMLMRLVLLVLPSKSISLQLRFWLLSVTPYFKIKAFLIHSLSGIISDQKCQYFHSAVHALGGIDVVATHGNLSKGLTSIVPGTVRTQNKSWFPLQVFKLDKCFGLKSFEWI